MQTVLRDDVEVLMVRLLTLAVLLPITVVLGCASTPSSLPGSSQPSQAAQEPPTNSAGPQTGDERLPEPGEFGVDVVIKELDTSVYVANLGNQNCLLFSTEIIDKPSGIDFSPMFFGKTYKFVGDIRQFIAAVPLDSNGKPSRSTRIVAITHAENLPLAQFGAVKVNGNGIVEGTQLRSGWINMPAMIALGQGTDQIRLEGVSFWINEGGGNWISFEADRAVTVRSTGPGPGQEVREVPLEIRMVEAQGGVRRPVIRVGKSQEFEPVLESLRNVKFVPVKR